MSTSSRRRIRWIAGALSIFAVACGTEIARIPLRDVGTGKAIVDLDAGQKIALWTQLDVTYSGTLGARYHIELADAQGAVVGSVTCSPLDITARLRSVRTSLGGTKSDRYQGKMAGCELEATGAGTYTVRATLEIPTKPPMLTLNDASVVIKK